MTFALLVAQYNDFVTSRLEAGARAALVDAGVDAGSIQVMSVPGTFELPQAAARVAATGQWSAIVCLGCLIRGETPHFEYIAAAAAHGITQASQQTGIPMAFGVLTTNTAEEALARAGDGAANKGREAAEAALAMARLYATLPGRPAGAGSR